MNNLNKITITEIINVVTVPSPRGRSEKMYNRKNFGLSFCLEGQITYTHNGRKYISDPEHAILLPKGQSYSIYGNKTGAFPVINFECINFSSEDFLLFPTRNSRSLLASFDQLSHLFINERNRTKCLSLLYEIIHALSCSGNTGTYTLLPAIRYLEENHFSSDITNKFLADKCNISEVYFRKLFRETYGVTPRQYIIDNRINKAKHLLQSAILNISAISEECGFSNPYHFSRIFKAKTGLTPTEYMNRNRITTI